MAQQQIFKIAMVGDSKAGSTAAKTFSNIAKEKPNHFVFLGDTSYNDDDSTPWCQLIDRYGLKPIMKIIQGNHEDDEEDAIGAQKSIEKWMPELIQGQGGVRWTSAYQLENCYFINMNSQDLDYPYVGRQQYKWVYGELGKAYKLRQDGVLDWIFVNIHKPIYTLKTKHVAELKARDIYQPLFDKAQVDFVNAGHNHDGQAWYPMAYNAKKLFTMMPDKKTFNFSLPHGQFYMINGLAGRGQTPIKEDWKKNKNVMYASWSWYGYTLYFVRGKQVIVQYKTNEGKVVAQYAFDRTGGVGGVSDSTVSVQPRTPPTRQINPPPSQKPTLEDPRYLQQQRPQVGQYNKPEIVTVPPSHRPPPKQQQTPPAVKGGTIIWQSKGIWDNGKPRTFTSTDPMDPNSQMRAGENRSCRIDGKGIAYFSGARGRMYWYRNNYDFIMQFEMVWNDSVENIGLRGRSRHNEGGSSNDFGGYGANYHKDHMDFKSEDSHSGGGGVGSEKFKYPRPFQAGKAYGIRYQLKDNPKPTMTFWIDYRDGKGFIKIGQFVDENPEPFRVDKKAFAEISYLWLRTNNEGGMPKNYAVRNMVIYETSGIRQSGNKGADYGGASGE